VVTSLRRLLLVPPTTPLKKIMSTDVISVRTDTDQEEVARVVQKYDLLGVPVVDEENKLVGVVTFDDVFDVIREEATAFLASSVVGLFTDTISKIAILAALMPIVAGMGGNSATQTLAVIVRG